MYANHKDFHVFEEIRVKNTMVTSYFGLEVEIWPFRACAVKNMQYNPYLWPNCQNFRILKEIGVEEHDDDIRFKTGSGNMAISCTARRMKNM